MLETRPVITILQNKAQCVNALQIDLKVGNVLLIVVKIGFL